MMEFGVISFLILVFVVTRNQGAQRELKQIQHAFQPKLAPLHKSAWINNQDHEVANFILENFRYVSIMNIKPEPFLASPRLF